MMKNKKMTTLWLSLLVLIVLITIGAFYITRKKPSTSEESGYVLYQPEKTRTYSLEENVILDHVQLVTQEDIIAQNTTIDEISKLIEGAEQKLREHFAENKTEFKLLVQFTIYPSEAPEIKLAYQGNIEKQELGSLRNELMSLAPIYTKTDNIVFQAAFTIKAK